MKRLKKIVMILSILLIAIQFIQPALNEDVQIHPTHYTTVFVVPENMQSILRKACYDCHSKNTKYVWHSNIQPMGWVMAKHIKNGKEGISFSEFGGYSLRKQVTKLKGIAGEIRNRTVPLLSCKIMHNEDRLSREEKLLVTGWKENKVDSYLISNSI